MRGVRLLATLQLVTWLVIPAAGGAPDATPTLGTLLARHVPVLVLHPAEQFRPVPVDGFLADSDVQQKTAAGWEKVDGPLPAGGADLRLDQRLCRAIEGLRAAPCYASAEAAHGSPSTAYGAAFRSGARIALQYWLWYPYNDYSPTVAGGDVWQVHEGDWESVSVLLDRSGKPLLVGLSRHCSGARRDWAKVPKRGIRPLVHVALGSHANFFAPGKYPHDPRCWPPELRNVVTSLKFVDHVGKGRTLRPRLIRVSSAAPSWMRFAGSWGETAYIHFPNNPPVAYGAGPSGPAFHKQWRAPVREVLSWPRD